MTPISAQEIRPAEKPADTEIKSPPIEESISLFINDFMPATGKGQSPQHANNGPWGTRVMLASSSDGIHFKSTGERIVDQAGVPNLIIDHEGYLRLYYQAWQDKGTIDGNDGNFMAVAVNNPIDSAWYYRKLVLDRKFSAMPVDPSVVLLPDGRYRLYFMADTGQMNLRIFSAISDDGIQFAVEDGIRISPKDDQGIFDPMVVKINNGWLLIAGGGGKYSATSDDGLSFNNPVQFVAEGKHFHAWAGVALQDGYHIYGNFLMPPKFTTLTSQDGVTWTDKGFTLEGGTATDVGVAVLPDGTFIMAYLDRIE